MRKALFKGDHCDIARSLTNIGICCDKVGDSQTALSYSLKALMM